jgi:predicted GNAT family N-acyltransferase
MAVEVRSRGLGVGGRLLEGAEEEARSRGATRIVLNAQRRAEEFYGAHGYVAEGETFVEAGIEHVRMRKEL